MIKRIATVILTGIIQLLNAVGYLFGIIGIKSLNYRLQTMKEVRPYIHMIILKGHGQKK